MQLLPEKIKNIEQLDEIINCPTDSLVDFIKQLDGDIMVLGAGGKIGPNMVMKAKRAIEKAQTEKKVYAVDLVSNKNLSQEGVETITCDLMDIQAVSKLPKVKNIIYMAGRKFGSTGNEHLTWAINVAVPHNVASIFTQSNIAVFSTGCVYPIVDLSTGGSTEQDKPQPIGEYAMSSLGRERIFDYYSAEKGEKIVHIRLNYALDLRYGVIFDIARKVFDGEPVDVTTGYFNGIWQGDVCEQVIRSLTMATSPANILNITGPEIISVRWLANKFANIFSKKVEIFGNENGKAYLSNATKANAIFGNPTVPIGKIIAWTADWIENGKETLNKPTHFEVQNGQY